MDVVATTEHCMYCFDTLVSQLHPEYHAESAPAFPDDVCPLFVTWKKSDDGGNWVLRGCIGTFGHVGLRAGLSEYATRSAFRDRRFSPIAKDELPLLRVSISLLTNFEDAANVWDWEIGVHGIRIQWSEGGTTYSATYLPQVAPEQGWNREEALRSLIRKAGYKRIASDELFNRIALTRYQASITGLGYGEYVNNIANGSPTVLRPIPDFSSL